VRSKVGTGRPTDHGLLYIDLSTREHTALDLSTLPGIDEDPLAFLSETEESTEAGEEPGEADPRPVALERLVFSPDGQRAAVQLHSFDNKDRWIALVDREGSLQPIHRLSHVDGWINWYHNELGWTPDGRYLWFLSEESGWSQLYVHEPGAGETRRLTEGQHVVADVELSRDGRFACFTANPEHPGHYNTFRVELATGSLEQLTQLGGLTRSWLSPDGTQLLVRHSSLTRPPELYLQEARPGAEARRLTSSTSDAFDAIDWTEPELVPVPSRFVDRPIWSRLYLPASSAGADRAGTDGRRPAVVFVHGAGYLQNSHGGWSGYFREFMFHSLLTRMGYVVLDMDYRGSRGYGRAWRAAVYRQMGHPEVEDLEDGVAWLVREHQVDPDRVGVYGGSYGGFLTFMSLFRRPGLFAAGAALRPVTDWAHYNHSYTSNILNTPEVDPEAYRKSSPIEYADGLADPLLICAPMLDDNVFFQDTVRLVQRLIELEKTGFETALYPVEPHGFQQPSSWLDEYRRILALFEEHLVPAPR